MYVCMYVWRNIEAFTKPLLPRTISTLHIFVCVCVCEWVGVGVCLRASNLNYPASNAHAPFFFQPLWLHLIFRKYLMKGTIFGKTLMSIKCVFWFSLQLLFETFFILRRIQRDIVINMNISSCKVPFILDRIWNLNFLDIFLKKKKRLNIKFYQNPSSGSPGVSYGHTDLKLIFAFRNFSNAPKNTPFTLKRRICIYEYTVMTDF